MKNIKTTTQPHHGGITTLSDTTTAETATLMSNDFPSGTVELIGEVKPSTQEYLEMQIKRAFAKLNGLRRKSLKEAIRIGEMLNQLKSMVGHGKWSTYIDTTLGMKVRTAVDYMKLASEPELKNAESADLSIADTLRSLRNANKPVPCPKAELKLVNGRVALWEDGVVTTKHHHEASQAPKNTPDILRVPEAARRLLVSELDRLLDVRGELKSDRKKGGQHDQ